LTFSPQKPSTVQGEIGERSIEGVGKRSSYSKIIREKFLVDLNLSILRGWNVERIQRKSARS